MHTTTRLTALGAVALLLTGCGGADADPAADAGDSGGATAESAFPVTIGSGESAVEITDEPERIVSLSPTATEMLFAIDAGDAVVAADAYSNHPAEAPTTELSGYEPNVEAIIDYEPDLVVASADPGGLADGLAAIGVPTVVLPSAAALDDSFAQIEQLGAATGRIGEAAELVAQMQADIDAIVAEIPDDLEPATYFHELDPNFYTVTGATFIGELYGLVGLTSIADETPEAGGDYPQLSPEFILAADPDVIFFADGADAGVTAEAIAARPGWDQLTAVQQERIIEVDKDIASRWGPRAVDFLRVLADARAALQPVG